MSSGRVPNSRASNGKCLTSIGTEPVPCNRDFILWLLAECSRWRWATSDTYVQFSISTPKFSHKFDRVLHSEHERGEGWDKSVNKQLYRSTSQTVQAIDKVTITKGKYEVICAYRIVSCLQWPCVARISRLLYFSKSNMSKKQCKIKP